MLWYFFGKLLESEFVGIFGWFGGMTIGGWINGEKLVKDALLFSCKTHKKGVMISEERGSGGG